MVSLIVQRNYDDDSTIVISNTIKIIMIIMIIITMACWAGKANGKATAAWNGPMGEKLFILGELTSQRHHHSHRRHRQCHCHRNCQNLLLSF